LKGIAYRSWGANCLGWERIHLDDVFFKFALQFGFKDKGIIKQSLNLLSLVKKWRKNVLIYMSFIEMNPYYDGDYD
jgi:hypothetical protein